MTTIRLFTPIFGAGLVMALTMALALPAQEPAPDAPPPDDHAVEPDDSPASSPSREGMRDLSAEDSGTEVEPIVATESPVPPEVAEETIEAIADEVAVDTSSEEDAGGIDYEAEARGLRKVGEGGGELIRIMGDALLAEDETANEVVAIMGNTVIDGVAKREAVAILGDATVNGLVGRELVAVLGNVEINGRVGREVVAIMGNVQLGPEAVVDGEIVCIGGTVERAPGAVVKGPIHNVPIGNLEMADGLRAWVQKCLLMGRPLAIDENLGWLWTIMLVVLGCYVLLALMLPSVVTRCASTMEASPGMSLLSAVLTVLITPIAMIVLSVTVIGPVILGLLLLAVGVFGKVVFLAWLGRRITEPAGWKVPALAVLIGGLITLAVYLVPILGFIFQKFSGFLGTGIVIYTIIQAMQDNSGGSTPAPAAATSGQVPPAPTAPSAPAGAAASGAAMGASAMGGSVISDAAAAPTAATTQASPDPTASDAAPPSSPPPAADLPAQLSTLPRVGFWARIAATLIDVIALGIAVGILGLGEYFVVVATLYFILLWGLKGTTLGGVVLGIKLVRLDDKPVDWAVALVRALGAFLSLCVVGLGFIWVVWDPQRQSWHDKIAGTTLVKMPKGVSLI